LKNLKLTNFSHYFFKANFNFFYPMIQFWICFFDHPKQWMVLILVAIIFTCLGRGFLFNRKKGSFLSNVEYAYILSTGGCIHFLENSGHFWRSQGIFFNCFGRHYVVENALKDQNTRKLNSFHMLVSNICSAACVNGVIGPKVESSHKNFRGNKPQTL